MADQLSKEIKKSGNDENDEIQEMIIYSTYVVHILFLENLVVLATATATATARDLPVADQERPRDFFFSATYRPLGGRDGGAKELCTLSDHVQSRWHTGFRGKSCFSAPCPLPNIPPPALCQTTRFWKGCF